MESNIVLSGNLKFIGLGELLQLLGGNVSTGILKLRRDNSDYPGIVYIVDGNPVNAETGNIKGLEALNRLFGWMDADYAFHDEPVTCEHLIKKSRMEIILDALRMVDDGEIEKVGISSEEPGSGRAAEEDSGLPVIKGSLIDYLYVVDEEEFSAGKEIVYQAKYGNWFWVILEGKVDVIRLLPEGKAPIARLSDGAFIGSIGSFMRKGSLQRSATVIAVTNVQLGVMDYDLLFKEYSELSLQLQTILASLDTRLRQVTTSCAKAVLNGPIPNSRRKDLKVFNCQDNPDSIYWIHTGEAVIVRKIGREYIELCVLGPNDFIGHIPFLNTSHEPHSASVYVSADFQYRSVAIMDVKKEYNRVSRTFKNLIQHTTQSISVTTGRLFDVIKAGHLQT